MESIDERFYKYNETSKKDTYTQKTSYWNDAYKIAGICSDDDNSNDGVFKRLDEYWLKICELLDEIAHTFRLLLNSFQQVPGSW